MYRVHGTLKGASKIWIADVAHPCDAVLLAAVTWQAKAYNWDTVRVQNENDIDVFVISQTCVSIASSTVAGAFSVRGSIQLDLLMSAKALIDFQHDLQKGAATRVEQYDNKSADPDLAG